MGVDSVWLLWHTHEIGDGREDSKLIGVYRTRTKAQAAQDRICNQPGFLASPNGLKWSSIRSIKTIGPKVS